MVFISYSSKEYATTLQIRSALESNRIECWMAPESIPAGSDYADEIQTAIENCEAFLLVLSAASQRSKWVRKELDKALDSIRSRFGSSVVQRGTVMKSGLNVARKFKGEKDNN